MLLMQVNESKAAVAQPFTGRDLTKSKRQLVPSMTKQHRSEQLIGSKLLGFIEY